MWRGGERRTLKNRFPTRFGGVGAGAGAPSGWVSSSEEESDEASSASAWSSRSSMVSRRGAPIDSTGDSGGGSESSGGWDCRNHILEQSGLETRETRHEGETRSRGTTKERRQVKATGLLWSCTRSSLAGLLQQGCVRCGRSEIRRVLVWSKTKTLK